MSKNRQGKIANRRRIKINDLNHPDFQDVVLGASMGLSGKAISEELNEAYSVGQVYYRAKQANVKIRDFRRGNWLSLLMLEKLRRDRHALLKIRQQIEEKLGY